MVAIETATETVGVAVRTAAGVQAELTLTGRRRHVETLTPALEHLLAQLDLVPGDLGVVGVDVGPGLFTGLRVGVAAAKGLAQALGIGVIGATSLDILTAGAAATGLRGLVLACIDARRGEVFAAVHEVDPAGAVGGVRLPVGLFAPQDLVVALEEFSGETVHAVGDGALRYADVAAGRSRDRSRRTWPGLSAALGPAPSHGGTDRRGRTASRARGGRSPLHARGRRHQQLRPVRCGRRDDVAYREAQAEGPTPAAAH